MLFEHTGDSFQVNVTNCEEPPKERLLREVDLTFLEALKKNMKEDPYGPGVPAVALLCTSVETVDEFKVLWLHT